MEDFILPKKYTDNVIDVAAEIDGDWDEPKYIYKFNIILTKEIETRCFFGRKSLILKKEKYTINEYTVYNTLGDAIKNLVQYKRMISYAEAIRKHIKNKKEGNNFNQLIDEGNEAIISPHQFVKDAFILKVVEELKKYNDKNL